MNISKSGLMILVLIISFLSVGCENNWVDSVKDNGSIKRYVYDFSTDEPLANCTITLFPTIGSTRSTDDGLFYFPSWHMVVMKFWLRKKDINLIMVTFGY